MFSRPVIGEFQSVFSGVFARNRWAEGTVSGTGALISHEGESNLILAVQRSRMHLYHSSKLKSRG